MTSKQISDENAILFNNAHKLMKKYMAIKQIVRTLNVSFLSRIPLL